MGKASDSSVEKRGFDERAGESWRLLGRDWGRLGMNSGASPARADRTDEVLEESLEEYREEVVDLPCSEGKELVSLTWKLDWKSTGGDVPDFCSFMDTLAIRDEGS